MNKNNRKCLYAKPNRGLKFEFSFEDDTPKNE